METLKFLRPWMELLVEESKGTIKIDVVDICNRPHLHAEHAIKAAKSGKHLIIIEKPIASVIEDCYEKEQGRKFIVT